MASFPQYHQISIHAPTNGATIQRCAGDGTAVISIHAPTNGATAMRAPMGICRLYFNPRSDERSDHMYTHFFFQPQISIHAPTNGATVVIFAAVAGYIFQSTLRRTERPRQIWYSNNDIDFNPRSDERSDVTRLDTKLTTN